MNIWKQTISVYINALEHGEQQAKDAAAAELITIANYLNKTGVKYPDILPDCKPQPKEWR